MGKIVSYLEIENAYDASQKIAGDALVDTGAAYIVLPMAWKKRLGDLVRLEKGQVELGNQTKAEADICGPVKAKIEGFRSIFTEVLFIEMNPDQGYYEPLIGYIPLEQSQAAVDMLSHRLIRLRTVDLKKA